MMMTAIGLMSGTSLDGVDVALIETDGKRVKAFGPSGYRPYTDSERGLLRQALTEAVHLPQRDARPGILREAERAVTIAHAEAVAAFTAQNRITCEDIDIVGFHGQTVLHRPAQKMTVQIGDAAALARAIHIPVMHDFRAADVAAGGQGAPFVPVYHRALAQSLEREGPIVVVNIGGVSNITYIDGADTLIACDTGPGNALLDDFMFRTIGQPFDCEGRMAAQGNVDVAWVRAGAGASLLCTAAAEIARPQRFCRADAARDAARRWRGDPDGASRRRPSPGSCRCCRRRRRAGSSPAAAPAISRCCGCCASGWRRRRSRPPMRWAGRPTPSRRRLSAFWPRAGLKGLPLSYPATTGVPIPMTGGVIARP